MKSTRQQIKLIQSTIQKYEEAKKALFVKLWRIQDACQHPENAQQQELAGGYYLTQRCLDCGTLFYIPSGEKL